MFGQITNNRIIRKVTMGFGSLFANLVVVRYNWSTGTPVEQQRFVVPCSFGQKEKYIQALQGDPLNDNKISISLPQLAYNLIGIEYDGSRKQQTMLQNFNQQTPLSGVNTQYIGVPWNLKFEVYIYVRTVEDGAQIIEQILPYFTPNYTLIINLVSQMGIQKDIPIVLDSANYEVLNESEARDPDSRVVMWILNFTAKTLFYGPISPSSIIKEAIVGIYNWPNTNGQNLYLVLQSGGSGKYLPTEQVYQGGSQDPTGYATVVDWVSANNRLLVTDAQGMFFTNTTLTGLVSGAQYNLINYEIVPQQLEKIDVTANTSNSGNIIHYNVTKTYFNTAR